MIALVALASCEKDPEYTISETDNNIVSYKDGLYVKAQNYDGTQIAETTLNKGKSVNFSKKLFPKVTVTCPYGPGCEYLFNGTRYFTTKTF